MDLLLKDGHVIDPDHLDGQMDILIQNGRIQSIIPSGQKPDRFPDVSNAPDSLKIIDLAGKVVTPGFFDMHVHFREPGQEHKETIQTGSAAAVHGGFTGVCTMPNTDPANDSSSITTYILEKARQVGMTKVYPCGAISHGLKGIHATRFDELKKAGVVALSDDGMPVTSSRLMRKALENARNYDLPVISHAEDLELTGKGAMNEGRIAEDLKIPGIPNAAESIMVQRDIALADLTGARVHIAHVSTRESVWAIRAAKQAGIPVTSETAPHYFMLTHDAVKTYGTNAKMNPPLRSAQDRAAIIEGLVDGTIDAIATDHAPHHPDEKKVAFEKAPNGIIGLETSLSLGLTLVAQGHLTLVDLIRKMSVNPCKILNIPCGLNLNASADITVIDLGIQTRVNPESFQSKSRNTPFDNWTLKGGPFLTIVDGRIVYQTC
jgi:dihydroorotase